MKWSQFSGNKIFKLTEEQIKQIGNYVVKNHFENLTREKLAKELEPVNEIYNLDNIEYFMEDPVCAQCGKLANSRCSRCKSEWYCSKECQIKRWKEHKTVCKTLAALFKENENDLSKKKIEFNHIKVSGDQISQEVSSGELDINKVKEENDKKMKKIFVEEIKDKKEEKKEKKIDINKNEEKKEIENENSKEIKEKEKEKDKGDKNELDDLD